MHNAVGADVVRGGLVSGCQAFSFRHTHTYIHKLCTKMVIAYVKIYYKADGYNGNVVMLIRYSLLMASIASLSEFARNGL